VCLCVCFHVCMFVYVCVSLCVGVILSPLSEGLWQGCWTQRPHWSSPLSSYSPWASSRHELLNIQQSPWFPVSSHPGTTKKILLSDKNCWHYIKLEGHSKSINLCQCYIEFYHCVHQVAWQFDLFAYRIQVLIQITTEI